MDSPKSTPPGPNVSDSQISTTLPWVDEVFNFNIVIFQVGNTLFPVLKNSFNRPGTIFEAMFSLPSNWLDSPFAEGNSLENPIHLDGIEESHFRAFLIALYPLSFIGQEIKKYEDWVGVLHLATMWDFKEIRAQAITTISSILNNRTALEKISLGRRFRMIDWVRNGYLDITLEKSFKLEKLRRPSSHALDWESIAKLLNIRETALLGSIRESARMCTVCSMPTGSALYGPCKCPLQRLIMEVFQEEWEEMKNEQ